MVSQSVKAQPLIAQWLAYCVLVVALLVGGAQPRD